MGSGPGSPSIHTHSSSFWVWDPQFCEMGRNLKTKSRVCCLELLPQRRLKTKTRCSRKAAVTFPKSRIKLCHLSFPGHSCLCSATAAASELRTLSPLRGHRRSGSPRLTGHRELDSRQQGTRGQPGPGGLTISRSRCWGFSGSSASSSCSSVM